MRLAESDMGGLGERRFFSSDPMASQGSLLRVRLMTREHPPEGGQIALVGRGDDNYLYYCKDDRCGLPIRMREAVYGQLARAVGLATPDFRVIEDEASGESYFGSRQHPSTIDRFEVGRFWRSPTKNELGMFSGFPGRWLSQLLAFDLFIGNWDRTIANIVAVREGVSLRLCPIDFASAELGQQSDQHFPVVSCATHQIARQLSSFHGFFPDSAEEMLKLIGAISPSEFKSFFRWLPPEWVNVGERETLCGFWAGDRIRARLEALRAILKDGLPE